MVISRFDPVRLLARLKGQPRYARLTASSFDRRASLTLIPVTVRRSPVPVAVPPRRRGHSFDCE